MAFVLVMSVILLGSALISILTNTNFASVIPFWIFAIILQLYVFSFFNILLVGVYFVYILLFCLFAYAAFLVYKKGLRFHISRFAEPWLVIYLLLSIFSYLMFVGAQFSQWDDFSHWGMVVKAMHFYDSISPFNPANLLFRGYPPGLSLWSYFATHSSSQFSEADAIWSIRIFELSLLPPFLQKLDWRKPLEILCVCTLFLLVIQVFPYSLTMYADLPLGLCFGFLLTWVFIKFNFRSIDFFAMSLGLSVLVLSKDLGKFFAFTIVFFLLSRIYHFRHQLLEEKRLIKTITFALLQFVVVIAVGTSWKYLLDLQHVQTAWSGEIRWRSLLGLLDGSAPEYWQLVIKIFLHKIFREQYYGNTLRVSVPLAAIICFWIARVFFLKVNLHPRLAKRHNFFSVLMPVLSVVAYLIVFVRVPTLILVAIIYFWIVGIFFLESSSQPTLVKRTDFFSALTLVLSWVAYVIVLLLAYLFYFGEYEAIRAASIWRYLSSYFVGLLFFVSAVVASISTNFQKLNFTSLFINKKMRLFGLYLAAICTAMISLSVVVLREEYRNPLFIQDESVQLMRDEIKTLALQIQQAGLKNGDKVWFISQHSNGFEYWIMRYELLNVDLGGSWSIGFPSGDSDVWTNSQLTVDVWGSQLREFKFVAIYNLSDAFISQYSKLFGGITMVNANSVYRVIPSADSVNLIQVN